MAIDLARPLDSFSGVAKNSTATVTLPGGVVYDALHVEYNHSGDTDFDISKISDVKLNLNGESIIECSGQDLIDLEAYKGNPEEEGYFTIQLAELVAKTFDGKHAFGLITSGADSISLEVTIGETNAVVPTLKGFADTRPRPMQNGKYVPRVWVPKIRNFPAAASAGGPFEISNLPRRADVRLKRVLVRAPNATNLQVERDQIKMFDLSKARNEYIQARHKKVPLADTIMFDPIADGFALAKLFPTASNSLVFRLQMSAAGEATALVESVWLESNPR